MDGFLEPLVFCLKSMYIIFEGKMFTQKSGVCNGAGVAPVLSDILQAKVDSDINSHVQGTEVDNIFRYVNDFLVILKTTVLIVLRRVNLCFRNVTSV